MRLLLSCSLIMAALAGLACNQAAVPTAAQTADAKEPAASAKEPAGGAKRPAAGPLSFAASRNMANLTAKNVPDDFAVRPKGKERNVLWSAALGTKAYGGPVVAGGKIYVGTNNERPRDKSVRGDRGVLMCFDAADGKFLWQHAYQKLDDVNDNKGEGIASSPWVEGDLLWYVNNRAEFICSDTSGKVVWKYDMVKKHDVFVSQLVYTSPLVVGDLVYALTCNGVDPGTGQLPNPKAPSLVALHKKTGKLAWTDGLPGANVMRGQWSNPSAAVVNGKAQVIYGGGDGWLYGLDALTGKLVWRFDYNPKAAKPYQYLKSGDRSFLIGAPVVYDNKVYVGVGREPDEGPGVGHLWCVDITKTPANKDKDLSPVGDNFDPRAKANAASGLVWHVGGAVMPKPKDDAREHYFGRTLGTVAAADGLVYASEIAGYLSCFDARTGEKYWEHDFQESTWCSPYYVDGKVFMGVDSADLFVFKAGKKLAKPRKIALGNPVKVPPAAGDGVLYVNNGTTLFAIKK